jgi:cell division protein FtsL
MRLCKEKSTIDDVTQYQIEELKKMFERKIEEQQKNNEELKKKVEELKCKEVKSLLFDKYLKECK